MKMRVLSILALGCFLGCSSNPGSVANTVPSAEEGGGKEPSQAPDDDAGGPVAAPLPQADPCGQSAPVAPLPEDGWTILLTRFAPGSSARIVYVASQVVDNVTHYALYADVVCGASARQKLADVDRRYFAWDASGSPVFVRGNTLRKLSAGGTESTLPTPPCGTGSFDAAGDRYYFSSDWLLGASPMLGDVATSAAPCQPVTVGSLSYLENLPRLSPDGNTLLFGHEDYFETSTCDDPALTERKFVAASPMGGAPTFIPVPQLTPPICSLHGALGWLSDSKRALYIDHGQLYVVDTDSKSVKSVSAAPFAYEFTEGWLDVSTDGKRFLVGGTFGRLAVFDTPAL